MKQTKDEGIYAYLDSKQKSYKLICNSEYGNNDYPNVSSYNMYDSSLVTK